MSDSNLDDSRLHHWQQLHFQYGDEDSKVPKKTELLRGLLTEVEHHWHNQRISPNCGEMLFNMYAQKYMGFVDCPDEELGMNNFADGALALARGNRNESKSWTSSLTKTTLQNMDCVKKLLQVSKKKSDELLQDGDILIGSVTDENDNTFGKASKNKPGGSTSVQPPGPSSSFPAPFGQKTAPSFQHGSNDTAASTRRTNGQSLFGNQGASSRQSNFFGQQNNNSAKPKTGHSGETQPSYSFSKAVEGKIPFPVNRPTGNKAVSGPSKSFGSFSGHTCNPPERGPMENPQDDVDNQAAFSAFRTAKEQLAIDNQRRNRGRGGGGGGGGAQSRAPVYGTGKKSLGTRRGLSSQFVPPVLNREDEDDDGGALMRKIGPNKSSGGGGGGGGGGGEELDEKYKHLDQKMVELIMSEVMDHGPAITWDDIAGLEFAKATIKEIVVWPMLRPDIFTGLRGPPKGLLLFGPPGTGKTLIGKCIASQSKSTFFSISASSLTSKWVGEGEKMVRTLFAVARLHQPAVIFIDEIDSLLTQRTDGEHEASRRIKTEFLVQLDGATTDGDERLLVVGATNRPQEIDEAARRRFVKRLYIPLPEMLARKQIISNLLSKQTFTLSEEEVNSICTKTDGYSGADMANLCREAALGPIRSISFGDIEHISPDQVRPIMFTDFEDAIGQVRASVSSKDLDLYIEWNKMFGSGRR